MTAAEATTEADVQAFVTMRPPRPDVPAAITRIPAQAPIPTLGVVPWQAPSAAEPAPAVACGRQLVPLSETRHKVQFTASDELRKKLERAQDLMRHTNAAGDLPVVV